MNPQDYYTSINLKSTKLYDYLTSLSFDELTWFEHFGFQASEVDISWLDKDPALNAIHKIQPIKQLGILQVFPNTVYDWHVELHRLSSINMLIKHKHSHCLFGELKDEHHINVLELIYQPQTYYLLNTKKYHSVLNFEESRYMFSLYFEDEIDYTSLKVKLKDLHD